jgi:hypothetical protein
MWQVCGEWKRADDMAVRDSARIDPARAQPLCYLVVICHRNGLQPKRSMFVHRRVTGGHVDH